MAGRIKRGIQLAKEALNVLKLDKELLWFPILSGIFSLILFAVFTILLFFYYGGSDLSKLEIQNAHYGILFVYYLVSYFFIIFFMASLVGAAHIRLKGGDPTVKDGLALAFKRIGKLFSWALISAIVGLIFRVIVDQIKKSDKIGPAGKIIAVIITAIIGLAWYLLTFFMIPILLFEDLGVFSSIKRSGQLFKKSWGETFVSNIGIGAFFFLFYIGGFILFMGIAIYLAFNVSFGAAVIAFLSFLLYVLVIVTISKTLQGIVLAALYIFATTGKVPKAFSPDLIKHAFVPKKKKGMLGGK